jgi:plastocyanin
MSNFFKIIFSIGFIIFFVMFSAKKLRKPGLEAVSQLSGVESISLAPKAASDYEARKTEAPVASAPTAVAESKPVSAPTAAPASASVETSPGAIVGRVTFSGKAPPEKKQSADADPKCKAAHPSGITLQNYVVAGDGGLAGVLVYVKDGLGGQKFPPSSTPIVLDQLGCMYNPMVIGVQVGQPLIIQNSDDTMHNVNAKAKKNKPFNIGQPKKGDNSTQKFDKAEVFINFKCDVHPWMSAYVGVVDHPFFAVSGLDGNYKISGLPESELTLVAVHPKAGESKPVKVKAGGKADFVFEGK